MNLERAMTRAAQSGLFDEVAASGNPSPLGSWDSGDLEDMELDWGAADYDDDDDDDDDVQLGRDGRDSDRRGESGVSGSGSDSDGCSVEGRAEAQRVQGRTNARVEQLVQRIEQQQADRILSSMDGQEAAGGGISGGISGGGGAGR
jgi:hypothetical protein